MKQKILIKVCVNSHKSRSKALKISVGVSGVDSAALKGEEKNEIEVTGEEIDVVELIKLIRKKVDRHAILVSVAEKKEEKKEEKVQPLFWSGYYPYGGMHQLYELKEPGCSIF